MRMEEMLIKTRDDGRRWWNYHYCGMTLELVVW